MISNTAMIVIYVLMYATLGFCFYVAAYAFGVAWIRWARLRIFYGFAAFLFFDITIAAGVIGWYLKPGPFFLLFFAAAFAMGARSAWRDFA